MSDYVFLVGDDYESSNKEYVAINTDKGKLISIPNIYIENVLLFVLINSTELFQCKK